MPEQGTIMKRIVLIIALALATAACQSEAEREKAWVDQCVANEMTPKQCAFLYGQIIHARSEAESNSQATGMALGVALGMGLSK
jgi:hypothetical protein